MPACFCGRGQWAGCPKASCIVLKGMLRRSRATPLTTALRLQSARTTNGPSDHEQTSQTHSHGLAGREVRHVNNDNTINWRRASSNTQVACLWHSSCEIIYGAGSSIPPSAWKVDSPKLRFCVAAWSIATSTSLLGRPRDSDVEGRSVRHQRAVSIVDRPLL